MTVLVDEVEEEALIARSYADAPEIDGVVVVEREGLKAKPGDFIEVEIVNSDTHDLYAKAVNLPTKRTCNDSASSQNGS